MDSDAQFEDNTVMTLNYNTSWNNETVLQQGHLEATLAAFNQDTPQNWLVSGEKSRHDLHGLIRYPAMMVPSMQGDILDAILREVGTDVHVIDPFVGSGTVMTEAVRRGLEFTGIDINPLAILICQAKSSVEAGNCLDSAVVQVLEAVKSDWSEVVEVDFHKRDKWFEPHQLILFSRFRRAILGISDRAKRSCLWVVFAETIRSCSRTRTSTYKLHKRPDGEVVSEKAILDTFERNLYSLLDRVAEYKADRAFALQSAPTPELICSATENTCFRRRGSHRVVITSPPYGDNRTTIPYGQFSYLALNWIPCSDLPKVPVSTGLANPAAIDFASLGGSLKDAEQKTAKIEAISTTAKEFFASARVAKNEEKLRKVGAFLWDYYVALKKVNECVGAPSHWVITSGNRTSAETLVPFDQIGREIIESFGGKWIKNVERRLPVKRMPSKNNRGDMITTESTLVASFG
ncbi:MAG: hypothetical protein HWE26_22810 [Alteromonadaceae bacterium]|nr:hypothetical protein [Alteromonadaceae bacterium]